MWTDDTEFNAQVSAKTTHGRGGRSSASVLQLHEDIRVSRDSVHRRHSLPERKGRSSQPQCSSFLIVQYPPTIAFLSAWENGNNFTYFIPGAPLH